MASLLASQLYGNATELVGTFIASTKPLTYDLYAGVDVARCVQPVLPFTRATN